PAAEPSTRIRIFASSPYKHDSPSADRSAGVKGCLRLAGVRVVLEAVVGLLTEIVLVRVDLGVHPDLDELGRFPSHRCTSMRFRFEHPPALRREAMLCDSPLLVNTPAQKPPSSRNSTGITIHMATAVGPLCAGSKRHLRTALAAASSSAAWPADRWTWTSSMRPSAETSTRRSVVPSARALRAAEGYEGRTW